MDKEIQALEQNHTRELTTLPPGKTLIGCSLFTALLVYVDDMIITGNDPTCVVTLKSILDAKFGIKDLESLKFFLGLEIARSKRGISLNQRKFALEILKETSMMGIKATNSLTEQQLKLLSQILAKPRVPHMQAAIRILQYIKGTPRQGILFPSDLDFQLKAYCDADWARCPDTRKSLMGYCVFLEML
ncbi:uncharacterized mitochondrial protein AtMg00810-like [Malania oleifera]|uniref:uncharacterized mitochondrial protein AtMg00810-like n=1 Tax=Malania oleifera TaxID=397392 RepID=UPI0025ADCAB4|nr:uncharacterized mitochondrial protein AtMg00810-like [Malania oleifera]